MTRPFITALLLLLPTAVFSQGRVFGDGQPLTNEGLRQAVTAWMGTDHNRAEITALKGPITDWDTSQVTTMAGLFRGASAFDEDLSQWNTAAVTDMSDMFNGASSFRGLGDFDQWDTSRVTTMARMFKSASSLASVDFTAFNTASVTDMSDMFSGATFLQGTGLDTWDVSQVEIFNSMFSRATNFNADISQWNLQSAKFMEGMFESAVSFNRDLSDWNLSTVTSIDGMFQNAANFRQSLCWDDLWPGTTTVSNLFCGAHLSAHLDPCCVSASIIGAACCTVDGVTSGSCDTFCRVGTDTAQQESVVVSEETSFVVSNDGDDDSIVEDNQEGVTDDGVTLEGGVVVTVAVFNTTTSDEGVYIPVMDATTTSAPTTSNDTTSTIATIPGNDAMTAVGLEGSSNTDNQESASSSDESFWKQHVWLQVIVYIFIALIAIMVVLHLLQKRGRRRSSAQTVPSNALQAKAAIRDEESGEEKIEVTTKKLYADEISPNQTNSTDEDKLHVATIQTNSTDEDK